MDDLEWRTVVGHINTDVANIVRAQKVLAEVHDELNHRTANPIEEDFIFTDVFGDPGAPRVRIVDGVKIQARVLHRRGLQQTDVKGADLLYDIAGRKFVLIQYKSPDRRGRVRKDGPQLQELIAACPNPCPPPLAGFLPTCGAWYAIRSSSEPLYLPACHADAVFGSAESHLLDRFSHGVGADVFDQLFARCWTGARTTPTEQAYLTWAALEHDRALFTVLQRGSFGR